MKTLESFLRTLPYDSVLLTIAFICFLGLIITSNLMLPLSSFFRDKKGTLQSLIRLEFPQKFGKLKLTLDNLSEKNKDIIKTNLKIDFYFMPCLYILMFCLSEYVRHHSRMSYSWDHAISIISILPFGNWVFDVLENTMTFSVIRKTTLANARFMFTFSSLKWLSGAIYVFFFLAMGIACFIGQDHNQTKGSFFNYCQKRQYDHKEPPHRGCHKGDEQAILAILYQQHAAEYRALCLQAYNIARQKIDSSRTKDSLAIITETKDSLAIITETKDSLAIITDLDETALDNSAYEAWLYLHDSTVNPDNLADWWNMKMADSIPGSVSFFKYADKNNVQIFYVSNRSISAIASTMENMRRLGFPQCSPKDTGHFLFKDNTSSKEFRRRKIIDTLHYHVVALLGDNLTDLDSSFDHTKSIAERNAAVDKLKDQWGDRYIVFPNAIYGDWESALYFGYPKSHTSTQQIRNYIRICRLHAY